MVTKAQVEEGIKAKAGNISAIARELGVARQTVYNKINQHPDLQDLLEDSREELVDIAESALRREVISGNITAIIFTLKTQGHKRGYIEQRPSASEQPITVNMTFLTQIIEQLREAEQEAQTQIIDQYPFMQKYLQAGNNE